MTIESAAPAPAAVLQPVESGERVAVIDIVRGMALFGILAANIRAFTSPASVYFLTNVYWPALHDRIAQAFIDTFVQGKFIAIFAFLFGVGFAVQFDRAAERGAKFGWRFARRLSILLLFGLIHGLLIWFGDILLAYALLGFLLLPFRKRTNKTIVVWALVFLIFLPLFVTVGFISWNSGFSPPDFPIPSQAELLKETQTFRDGPWIDIQTQRMKDAAKNWSYLPAYGWQVLGLFLLGILAWRKRFFQPSHESLPRYRRAMWLGLTIGAAGNIAATTMKWTLNPPQVPSTPASYTIQLLLFTAGPLLSLGYVCLVVVLTHDPAWRARLERFGNVGRMALTNYLLQSIAGTLLFYSYGLGLFGVVGPSVLLVVTFVLYAAQVVASRWWLERFRFGPAEWLWRRLTYKGPLPMVRAAAVAPADVATV